MERLHGTIRISEATAKKSGSMIIDTQIVVMAESSDALRQRNAARGLAQSFDTITEDNQLTFRPFQRQFCFTDLDIRAERNQLEQNAYMERMLDKDTKGNVDLVKEMQKNQLICIRMPSDMFGTDSKRDVYTTYWSTKIWLALQMRSKRLAGDRSKFTKVNLVVDELYQIKHTEQFMWDKLSQYAKFDLKPIISAHYLNQIKHIRDELRSANASYMLISGCDKKNYEELRSELYPYTEENLLRLPRYHSLNLIKNKDGYGRFITKLPAPVITN